MNLIQSGIKAAFEVTYQPGLNVGMTVVNLSGAEPAVGATTPMAHVINGTYVGYLTPGVGETYLVSKAVYTDDTLTTQDTDYPAGSETFYATGSADLSEVLAVLQAVAAVIAASGEGEIIAEGLQSAEFEYVEETS